MIFVFNSNLKLLYITATMIGQGKSCCWQTADSFCLNNGSEWMPFFNQVRWKSFKSPFFSKYNYERRATSFSSFLSGRQFSLMTICIKNWLLTKFYFLQKINTQYMQRVYAFLFASTRLSINLLHYSRHSLWLKAKSKKS